MSIIKKIDANIEKFYALTKEFSGKENDMTIVIVNNDDSNIEVRLKSQQYETMYEFPNRGNESIVYIEKSTNKIYRWDNESTKYYCVGSDYNQIKIIYGGNA